MTRVMLTRWEFGVNWSSIVIFQLDPDATTLLRFIANLSAVGFVFENNFQTCSIENITYFNSRRSINGTIFRNPATFRFGFVAIDVRRVNANPSVSKKTKYYSMK
jgi:hypothetical protein